jgi:hypothetical protein
MDAHFQEYLAAIAGMHDIYGDAGDEHPSEFHEAAETATATPGPVTERPSGCCVVPG